MVATYLFKPKVPIFQNDTDKYRMLLIGRKYSENMHIMLGILKLLKR